MTYTEKCIERYKNEGLIRHLALRVGRGEDVLAEHCESVTPTTLFDMASVTKIVVTTMLALMALEQGRLSLEEKLCDLWSVADEKLTVRHLLTHVIGSGHKNLRQPEVNADNVAEYILSLPPDIPIGSDVRYSCPAFIVLGKLLEQRFGMGLDAAFAKYVAEPLGMSRSSFRPTERTDVVNANKTEDLRGTVNDYNCQYLGGVAGNAGLFSCLEDMTKFARMLLSDGAPLLRPETLAMATRNYTPDMCESRGLGFLIVDERYQQTGTLFPVGSFGHCGHTGQLLFVHPESGLYCIILSDATKHAAHYDQVKTFRADMNNAIARDLGI